MTTSHDAGDGRAVEAPSATVPTPSEAADAAAPSPDAPPPPAEPDADTATDTAEDAPPPTWEDLGISEDLRARLEAVGWTAPTPVQAACFAPIAEGRDVLVESHTGSGKTGAFLLPWIEKRLRREDPAETGVQLLVLTPTRELAKQVCDELERLAPDGSVRAVAIYGGTAMQPQFDALRRGVHAVVGTPGRILDHIRRRSLDLSRVDMVVLDEADEMLSMGFLEDIRSILDACNENRQTTLFSATIPRDIERISKRYMKDFVPIRLRGDSASAAEIEHVYYSVSGSMKPRDLLDVIELEEPRSAIVFCNTREQTNFVASFLAREGYPAEPLSSDLSQRARERVMKRMREGKVRFLVATDVAARGIDISHVSHVINYAFPEHPESYVHRTGRTGRAGRAGLAISLVGPHDLANLYQLRLHYPSIEIRERELPPAEVLAEQRKQAKLDRLSQAFPERVAPEWVLLARDLIADPRGERIVALLLERALRSRPAPSATERAERAATEAEAEAPRTDAAQRSEEERGGRRRRRRRNRTGRSAEAATSELAPSEAAPATAEGAETATDTGAAPADTSEAAAAPGTEETTGEEAATGEGAPKKRRRRRRRRRSKREPEVEAKAEGADAGEDGEASAAPDATGEPEADARTEAAPNGKATEAKDAAEEATTSKEGRKRRRRRRRRTKAPENRKTASQDEIIIDIDEQELEIVRSEFGEIDEMDELTLKGRRRAVIDTLQDEVELEDVSDEDAARLTPTTEEEDEADAEAEGDEVADDSPEDEAPAAAAPTEDGDAAPAEDAQAAEQEAAPAKKKRRRRRRRKKKAPPPPELMVPPHKDFWEAWAMRFSYVEFEDEVWLAKRGIAPAPEATEETADEPPAPEPAKARPAAIPEVDPDAVPLVRVRLNVGRAQGKKAAHVRELLATKLGLEGRSVRDLTVREATTVCRVPAVAHAALLEVLDGAEWDGHELRITFPDGLPAGVLAETATSGTDGTAAEGPAQNPDDVATTSASPDATASSDATTQESTAEPPSTATQAPAPASGASADATSAAAGEPPEIPSAGSHAVARPGEDARTTPTPAPDAPAT